MRTYLEIAEESKTLATRAELIDTELDHLAKRMFNDLLDFYIKNQGKLFKIEYDKTVNYNPDDSEGIYKIEVRKGFNGFMPSYSYVCNLDGTRPIKRNFVKEITSYRIFGELRHVAGVSRSVLEPYYYRKSLYLIKNKYTPSNYVLIEENELPFSVKEPILGDTVLLIEEYADEDNPKEEFLISKINKYEYHLKKVTPNSKGINQIIIVPKKAVLLKR